MTTRRAKKVNPMFLAFAPDTSDFASFRKTKTHDYTRYQSGIDYAFDPADPEGSKAYMTAQGGGMQVGDYIVLQENGQQTRYQIERIDYYLDPSDMWIALLLKL